jgi:hypothetical protein
MTIRAMLVPVAVLFFAPAGLHAQGKELHWRSLDVEARLDAEGRLHLREAQAIVFTGEWNGGQRIFNLAPGQKVELHGVTRIASDGEPVALMRGDLDQVDHYEWQGSNTLRWRSRAPDDPPFAATEITYVLDYTLTHILVPDEQDREFILDHDFAFADREGPIERFTLALVLDPIWEPREARAFTGRYAKGLLPPGDSFVVRLPLAYSGSAPPAAVWRGASSELRRILGLLLLFAVGIEIVRFLSKERAKGRFAPLTPVQGIDDTWLGEHILHEKPEIVGAAYDNSTSAPEVAALIARLVGEGKIRSRVSCEKVLFGRRDVMQLELLADRGEFEGYERILINALFINGSTTDTSRIRAHYRRQGFDPANRIRAPIEGIVKRLRGPVVRSPDLSFRPAIVLVLAGIGGLVAAAVSRPVEVGALIASLAIGGVLALILGQVAYHLRERSGRVVVHSAILVALLSGLALGAAALVWGTGIRPSAFLLGAFILFVFGLCRLILTIARTRHQAAAVAMRRDLASARRFFMNELRRPEPRLRDEWAPYLIALGLGPHLDRWFRAFGARAAGSATWSGVGGSSSAAGGTSGGSWTGGGGAFGGGGATGSWAAAMGSMAAGVPAPSSSSSGGGGGGGGSSSGGGGGGGW